MLAERDQLRSRDPRKYSPAQLAEFVKELDGRHADLLEGWAKLCEDDAERLEALAGPDEGNVEDVANPPPQAYEPDARPVELPFILPERKEAP